MLSTMSSIALELNSSFYTTVIRNSAVDEFSVSVIEPKNATSTLYMLPMYIRTTSMVICIIVMALGIIGNLMVPLVVLRGKDMRNSTNIFLVNLSVADLFVLLICTPTVLVEVNSGPQVWPLGEHMCKAVPFVELTVAHASVLTILAISFERYYAICEPLRAGYVCTKARATFLCLLAWVAAALCTSPILLMVNYELEEVDDTFIPTCYTSADATWMNVFVLTTIIVFFVIPLLILMVLYTVIALHLMANPAISRGPANNLLKYRKQVVLMLGTVVLCFFLCLLPFRALTLWIIVVPQEMIINLGIEGYYSLLYFCRVMLYLNSAINPILYNLMSTKFREGFLRLCGLGPTRKRKKKTSDRTGTYTTGSTNCSSSNHSDFWRRHSSNKSSNVKVPSNTCTTVSVEKQINVPLITAVVTGNIVKKKQESYV
ncbi:PREDICTED: growth hormone secretagogue receptor type 1-like isoform X1 [Polistes dominula]|uniref:Growth hormone secretagogue receptor type 1-like isoform X1 n=1 Tax=Polistes dominula TaxID=743375 RepID=A0ABM1ILW6_POLDO|nr:PREDICTED: growth hormone secretagogue receptor type 1-like isoform X1 [Polistes dominula]XP_015181203.1 PREDICTED: growth hormone secretagogue receptor type 1-like isoform X1 [Polistes dominula]